MCIDQDKGNQYFSGNPSHMRYFKSITIASLIFICFYTSAQYRYPIRDEQGRQLIPRGFVVNTEDRGGELYFYQDDYHRMVKLGANFQVIRLKLGMLGGYPGNPLEENYLLHLDSLIQMGKNAGIRTDFKMTVYGTEGFDWGDFWRNKEDQDEFLVKAWTTLFERYKNEPAVFGYDLLNEPLKGDFKVSYEEMESAHLIPLIQKLIHTSNRINPEKKCLYQPILVNDPDRKVYHPPFIRMKTAVTGKNVYYAPHIYEGKKELLRDWTSQYEKDANVSGKPIFIGEWGNATFFIQDSSLTRQHEVEDIYAETVNLFDSLQVGTIKAWFKGTRERLGKERNFTWSLFMDKSAQGSIERKYIMDYIARPYPQCIAGDLHEFAVDFPTRTLRVSITSDNSKGASKIFIPADRMYPDGFTVRIGETAVIYNPQKNTGLEVINPGKGETTADLIWDPFRQQLIVLAWPEDGTDLDILVQPGIIQDIILQ